MPQAITKIISDKEIRQIIKEKYGIEANEIQRQNPAFLNEILQFLKSIEGASLRQISRLTELTVNKIYRA